MEVRFVGVDGFELAYDRFGAGPAVLLLHGWPEDRIAAPTVVLWPEHDPPFPIEWSDRIDEFFAQARLRPVAEVGHFAPLEFPGVIAEEVLAFLT